MIFDVLIDSSSAISAHERMKAGARFIPGRDMRDGIGAGDYESIEDKIVRIQSLVKAGETITRAEVRRMMRSPCEDSFSDTIAKLIVRKVLIPDKNKFRRAA